MFVSAIIGRVVRVHDGDPDAKEMKEYTIAKRAIVLLNDRKVGLADLHEGDEIIFNNGGKNGYERVTASRSKTSPFAVQSEKRDLGKPRLVQLVESEVGQMTPRFVDSDTPADEVGTQGSAIKHQGPIDPMKRDKMGHKDTGTEGADRGVVSKEGDDSEGTETRGHKDAHGTKAAHLPSSVGGVKDASGPKPGKK